MKRLTIALSDDEWQLLRDLIYFGSHKSASECIRSALLLRAEKLNFDTTTAAGFRRARRGRTTRDRSACYRPASPPPADQGRG